MISQKTIREIRDAAKIEDIIGDYVTLKKRGVNLLGLCPFHNEKTPSFTVSPAKNIYKCFGCGESGGSINFIMEHEGMTYPQALRHLAERYNIELDETKPSAEAIQERQTIDSLYLINERTQQFFAKQLFETEAGKNIALTYFKERGFNEDTIRKFGLGYAPNGYKTFTDKAVKEGYKLDLLQKAGVTSRKGFDFFRDRMMFVIHNLTGKVIGFGGRTLSKDKKSPKYINTPESEIYVKNKSLYGIYFAKTAIRKADECILVEGYTDVISLHQSGIENVVASSGTSLTVGQIGMVKRYTPNIKILYDGDPAGIKAAMRGLDMVLEQDMNVKVVLLPEGEDPDSYLRKLGADAFKQYISDNANDFILFKTNLLLKEAEGDPVKKARLVKDIVESISKVREPIKRSIYIKECAAKMDISEQILITEVNKIIHRSLQKREQQITAQQASDDAPPPHTAADAPQEDAAQIGGEPAPKKSRELTDEFQEKDIVRLIVEFGDRILEEEMTVAAYVLASIEDVMEEFADPLCQQVVSEAYEVLRNKQTLSPQHFTNHSDPNITQLAIALTHLPHEYSSNWEDKLQHPLQTQEMPDKNYVNDVKIGVKRFKFKKVCGLCEKNKEKFKTAAPDELLYLLKIQQKLNEMREALGVELGTVGVIR